MSGSSKQQSVPTGLLTVVVALMLVVLGLGAVVVYLQLQPDPAPETMTDLEIASWQETVDQNPDAAWAVAGLGNALLRNGQVEEARETLEQALEINPDQWSALLDLAVMTTGEDPEHAVEMLQRSALSAPRENKALPYVALGDLLLDLERPAEARTAFEEAIADNRFLSDAHFGLGRVLEALDDTAGAVAAYQRAAEFNPTSTEIQDALARLGATTTP